MTDTTKLDSASTPLPRRWTGIRGQSLLLNAITSLILAAGAGIIMIPFLYLLSTSVKDRDQLRQSPPPLIPLASTTVNVNGQAEPLYQVTVDGQSREMALIKNRPGGKGLFVDPANADQHTSCYIYRHGGNAFLVLAGRLWILPVPGALAQCLVHSTALYHHAPQP